MRKRLMLLTIMLLSSTLALPFGFNSEIAASASIADCANIIRLAANDKDKKKDWRYKRCTTGKQKQSTSGAEAAAQSGTSGGTAAGANDWITPGTPTYEKAKRAFDFMTQKMGVSGTTAAAILGEIQPEGNFVEDIAEYGGSDLHVKYTDQQGPCVPSAGSPGLHFGMTGKQPVCGMAYYADRGFIGGGGIFQFTPYTKFTNSQFFGKNGPGWTMENQLEFVFETSIWTRNIEHGCLTYGGAAPDVNGSFTVESWLKSTDPATAGNIFYLCFLKGAGYQSHRMDKARQANSVFNTANIQADESKWKIKQGGTTLSGQPGAPADPSSVNNARTTRNCNENCKAGDAKNNASNTAPPSVSGAKAWHHYSEIPDEVKKDAIDFTRFGLDPGKCEAGNWNKALSLNDKFLLGQCVAFSRMGAYVLWSKNGQPLDPPSNDGQYMAEEFRKKFGGNISDKPSKGAIGSISASQGGHSEYGHTAIALQSYSDGSILVAEQNNAMAGAIAGTACDWSYSIIPPNEAKLWKWYDPSQAGYTLSIDGAGSAAAAANASNGTPVAAMSGSVSGSSMKCTAKANSGLAADGSPLAAAEKMIGKKYVMGTAGPDTFDCSGLVVWSAQQAGYDMVGTCGRTAADQQACLRKKNLLKTDRAQCKVGDLIFWNDPADHVGFVSKDGATEVVHAANEQLGVLRSQPYNIEKEFAGCGPIPPDAKKN